LLGTCPKIMMINGKGGLPFILQVFWQPRYDVTVIYFNKFRIQDVVWHSQFNEIRTLILSTSQTKYGPAPKFTDSTTQNVD